MPDTKVKDNLENEEVMRQTQLVNEKERKECIGYYLNSLQTSLLKVVKTLTNMDELVKVLFTPTCPSNIGIARILFGLLMVVDIPDERGLSEIDLKYGDSMKCHFPLFNWLTPLPLEYMGILYFFMWLGAAGICLGYKFRLSCTLFTVPYWYIFLLDKTSWNNHSYLFGLISILFTFSSAHHTFSIDSRDDDSIRNKPVPLWNYAILRFQFFLLYFYAGVKKFDRDWIGGYSMTKLSLHWVFDPFRVVLTDDQIDLWIIHVFGFLFDLTVGFFLLFGKTRAIAMVFSTAFHLMNSRMFYIGQFPYVCLCMTPIFCDYDWPDKFWSWITSIFMKSNYVVTSKADYSKKISPNAASNREKVTVYFLLLYVGIQLFLPYSHFITKGYNNWTNGLYGYSWDMMVHNWDSILTVVKVVDNDSGREFYLDPDAWVSNSRFSKHGDMLIQYAQCLKRNLPNISGFESKLKPKFENISVYVDVWCSLNGRFQQRMFDPRQDLIKAEWSPFQDIKWLMPVMTELTPWRDKISDMRNEIMERSNGSGVLFIADFPGLYLDNYIAAELTNVTITVLQGTVILEKRRSKMNESILENRTLHNGDCDSVISGEFHRVYTVSPEASCYMYSFVNRTHQQLKDGEAQGTLKGSPLYGSASRRIKTLIDSVLNLRGCFNKFLYNTPIPVRMEGVRGI